MKTTKFSLAPSGFLPKYFCTSHDDDASGEYIPADLGREMLAALESVLAGVDLGREYIGRPVGPVGITMARNDYDKLRAIIAKAKGGD